MEKEILNMEEAASLFEVSVKTFIKFLKEEDVPARKIGREWRFSRRALIEWLSAGSSQRYSASEVDPRQYFDKIASKWEEISSDLYDRLIIDNLIQSDILNDKSKVLDFGSGEGYLSRNIASFVSEVIAVDASPGMLIQLQQKAHAQGIQNITVIRNDESEIPLESEEIDTICCSMVLHHIAKPQMVMKEFARVLKSNGTLFIADYLTHNDEQMKEELFDIWMGFDQKEIENWLLQTGFRINKSIIENVCGDKQIFMLYAEKI